MGSNIKNFSIFKEENSRPSYYRFVMDEIHIYIDEFMDTLKEKYNLNCRFLYNSVDGFSLEYFQSSNDNFENIMNVKKFMFEKAPYFIDLIIHKDDHRIVFKFVDPGDPIKFKFFY